MLGAYGVYVATAWARYGHPTASPDSDAHDDLLDRFLPRYDVVERHHIAVDAPADATLAAARNVDLLGSWTARAIFRAREVLLGAEPDPRDGPRGLMDEMQALGWRVLAEVPDREVVVGAITKPWEANVTFRGLPAGEFAAFDDPGYVKIVWTLRADPLDEAHSVFRTETRAVATSDLARVKFRRYWALLSPGVILIRVVMLEPVKRAAERRARAADRA